MRIRDSIEMHQTASPYIPPNLQDYACLERMSSDNGDTHYDDAWSCNLNHVALLPAAPVSQSGASFDSSFANYYSLSGSNPYYNINTSIPNELSGPEYNLRPSSAGATTTTLLSPSSCPVSGSPIASTTTINGYHNQYCPATNSENANYYMQDNLGNDIACDQDQCQSAFVDPTTSDLNGTIWSNCSNGGEFGEGSAIAIGGSSGYGGGESYTVGDSVDSYSSNVSINQGSNAIVHHNHTYSQLDGRVTGNGVGVIVESGSTAGQNGHAQHHRLLTSLSSSSSHLHHHYPSSSRGSKSSDHKSSLSDTSDDDHASSRDEKRAKALNIPISPEDIINLPIDEFNERLAKYELSEAQLSLIRDIRRRGKNKVAAQNCRRRKMDQILDLQTEVERLYSQKKVYELQQEQLLALRHLAQEKYTKLYHFILSSSGNAPVSTYEGLNEYSQQQIMVSQNSSTSN